MTLLDTNVLIYASDPGSRYHLWATGVIGEAVSSTGAAINAVSLAEACVGARKPEAVVTRIGAWGIEILDIPASAAVRSAHAYRIYRERRRRQAGRHAPDTPLPDFFIGAHAEVMGCSLATADSSRFASYFPTVPLITP